MIKPRIKAVILDMDGLVLDSETAYVSAWRQAAAAMGYPLDAAFFGSLSGLHGEEVERQIHQACGGGFDMHRFRSLSGEYWRSRVQQSGIPVKTGFFTLMAVIRGLELPFCLATNSRRADALGCLELAGLQQVFSIIIAKDDVAQGKPAPDIFIAAAAKLGVPVRECLVLEDSAVGVAAAVAAAAPCLFVPSIYPPDGWAADKAVAVLDDLAQAAGFVADCRADSG